MKCTPGLSGSLKEKPFLEDRNKQEKKEKTGKGKKNNRKRKDQEQEGEAREAESVFLMTRSVHQNLQKSRHTACR